MRRGKSTRPLAFFFLVLPSGVSSGFASITLPFMLTRAGFSVAEAAACVALGLSANLWRFLAGPIADLTLSARRWYLIGLVSASATVLVLGVLPLNHGASLVMVVTFVSQVAANIIVLPVGGLMAHTVADEAKGRAAGWYQAGNLGGNGLGGGAGVWLAAHFSNSIAGTVLALAMLIAAGALYFVPDLRIVTTESIGDRLRMLRRDLFSMVRSAIPLFSIVMVCSPIGAGALNNLWSAVAPDWHASDDLVALVSGVLNGVVSAIGCVIGGWVADRVGRWWCYFGSGVLIGLTALVMILTPRTPGAFAAGVLVYALFCGVAYAAFSAVVLFAIGRGAASTKYAAVSSLGNLPVVYMTALNGWAHDRFGNTGMLYTESLSAIACVAPALFVLWRINSAAQKETVIPLTPAVP